MEFNYAYLGESAVSNSSSSTGMNFAPDLNREPTYFTGILHDSVPFREAISALHDVVISDMRLEQKDREEYMRWLETQEFLTNMHQHLMIPRVKNFLIYFTPKVMIYRKMNC